MARARVATRMAMMKHIRTRVSSMDNLYESSVERPSATPALQAVQVRFILHIGVGLKQPEIFVLSITVRHPGKVDANRAFQLAGPRPERIAMGELLRILAVLVEHGLQETLPFRRHPHHAMMPIDAAVQEFLKLGLERAHLRPGCNKDLGSLANILDRGDPVLSKPLAGM